ncbi:Alpha/Beta hydrolase protein [Xylogone sp. PMI_703]|nr:Alpha/Beta hydrolase protein [Xylogone sp. PMI_703]
MSSTASSSGLVRVSSNPDIRLFYSLDGPLDGSKPILALSNSLAANTHLWDAFTQAFASQHTILRYDARFHGQSPLSSTPDFDYAAGHTIEDLASDVVAILDHLKIAKLHAFVGLSIGAAVGLVLGAQHLERVDRVLVVGTRAENKAEDNAGHAARIAYGREKGPLALGRQSISRWFTPDWIAAHPDEIAHLESIVGTQNIEGFQASIAALRRLDLWHYADEVKRKGDGDRFVFVVGEWDTPVIPESRQLAERAGSRMVIIPGSGHIVNVQQPERFHELVREVIEG